MGVPYLTKTDNQRGKKEEKFRTLFLNLQNPHTPPAYQLVSDWLTDVLYVNKNTVLLYCTYPFFSKNMVTKLCPKKNPCSRARGGGPQHAWAVYYNRIPHHDRYCIVHYIPLESWRPRRHEIAPESPAITAAELHPCNFTYKLLRMRNKLSRRMYVVGWVVG